MVPVVGEVFQQCLLRLHRFHLLPLWLAPTSSTLPGLPLLMTQRLRKLCRELIDGKVSTGNSYERTTHVRIPGRSGLGNEVKAQKALVPPLSGEPVLDATGTKNLRRGVQGSALKSANLLLSPELSKLLGIVNRRPLGISG